MAHHSAKQNNSDCAGYHYRIAMKLCVSRPCELQLQQEKLIVGEGTGRYSSMNKQRLF